MNCEHEKELMDKKHVIEVLNERLQDSIKMSETLRANRNEVWDELTSLRVEHERNKMRYQELARNNTRLTTDNDTKAKMIDRLSGVVNMDMEHAYNKMRKDHDAMQIQLSNARRELDSRRSFLSELRELVVDNTDCEDEDYD